MTKFLNIPDSVIGFTDPNNHEYTTMTLCEFFDLNKEIGAVQALCITNQLFRTNKAEYAYALLDVLKIELVSIALQALDSDEIENMEIDTDQLNKDARSLAFRGETLIKE